MNLMLFLLFQAWPQWMLTFGSVCTFSGFEVVSEISSHRCLLGMNRNSAINIDSMKNTRISSDLTLSVHRSLVNYAWCSCGWLTNKSSKYNTDLWFVFKRCFTDFLKIDWNQKFGICFLIKVIRNLITLSFIRGEAWGVLCRPNPSAIFCGVRASGVIWKPSEWLAPGTSVNLQFLEDSASACDYWCCSRCRPVPLRVVRQYQTCDVMVSVTPESL